MGQVMELVNIDLLVINLAWDAELILREVDQPVYAIFPPSPGDAAIAGRLGVTLAHELAAPVVVWKNTSEET